jgi:hypothetical protein
MITACCAARTLQLMLLPAVLVTAMQGLCKTYTPGTPCNCCRPVPERKRGQSSPLSAELKRFGLLAAALLVVWLWSLLHAQGFVTMSTLIDKCVSVDTGMICNVNIGARVWRCLLAGGTCCTALGLCNVLRQPGTACKVCQSVNTLQQVHRCRQQTEQVALVECGVCAYLLFVALLLPAFRVCAPQVRSCKAYLIASNACAHTIACCASNWSATAVCRLFITLCTPGACTGFVQHGNAAWPGIRRPHRHANRHAHLYIEVFCSSRVQLRLFAIYSGYCRMHRVCAACRVQPARSTIPTQHIQIGAVMSARHAGQPVLFMQLFAAICWCCVVTCTGFVRKTSAPQ